MNDERPIEKLLRRYAKQRRDEAGAPTEMHPATRRLLQGEVSRQFSKSATTGKESPSFARVLKSWWPWLAVAMPVILVVCLGAWLFVGGEEDTSVAVGPSTSQPRATWLMKNESQSQLARNEPVAAPTLKDLETPRPATAPVPQPTGASEPTALAFADKVTASDEVRPQLTPSTVAEADRDRLPAANGVAMSLAPRSLVGGARADFEEGARRANTDSDRQPQRAVLAEAAPVGGESFSARGGGVAGEKRAATGFELDAQGKTPLASTATGDIKTKARTAAASRSQTADAPAQSRAQAGFNQWYANVLKTETALVVLTNFAVEQTGNQVRVIDSDGSTYSGEMQVPTPTAGKLYQYSDFTVTREAEKADATISLRDDRFAKTAPQPVAPNYSFRVSGTNRTLREQVVFTGFFLAMTNSLGDAATVQLQPGGSLAKPLDRSTISGNAQIGTSPPVLINAVPVSR